MSTIAQEQLEGSSYKSPSNPQASSFKPLKVLGLIFTGFIAAATFAGSVLYLTGHDPCSFIHLDHTSLGQDIGIPVAAVSGLTFGAIVATPVILHFKKKREVTKGTDPAPLSTRSDELRSQRTLSGRLYLTQEEVQLALTLQLENLTEEADKQTFLAHFSKPNQLWIEKELEAAMRKIQTRLIANRITRIEQQHKASLSTSSNPSGAKREEDLGALEADLSRHGALLVTVDRAPVQPDLTPEQQRKLTRTLTKQARREARPGTVYARPSSGSEASSDTSSQSSKSGSGSSLGSFRRKKVS